MYSYHVVHVPSFFIILRNVVWPQVCYVSLHPFTCRPPPPPLLLPSINPTRPLLGDVHDIVALVLVRGVAFLVGRKQRNAENAENVFLAVRLAAHIAIESPCYWNRLRFVDGPITTVPAVVSLSDGLRR